MKRSKGQTLVETAILVPLLLILLCALIDLGRAMYTKNTLNHAARSGARVAVVTAPLVSIPPTPLASCTGEPAETIKNSVSNGIVPDSVQCELKIRDASGAAVGGPASTGDSVQVVLAWPAFPLITPVYRLAGLMTGSSGDHSGTLTLTGEASMRYE